MGWLLNWAGDWVTKDIEKAKVFDAFFASVFTGNICLQNSQVLETFGQVWIKETSPSAEEH